MARCPENELLDFAPVLDKVRRWPKIEKPKTGVLYAGRKAFFHFHLKDGRRWGDIKLRDGWLPECDVPEGDRAQADAFCRLLQDAYERV
jgi:hypothetical protein